MSIRAKDWHSKAEQLRAKGFKSRAIATALGVGKSTVNDYFARLELGQLETPVEHGFKPVGISGDSQWPQVGPKILFIDIETSPIIAHVWRLFDQNVGLNQIEADWSILSFCAKWKGSEEIIYRDTRDREDFNDDSALLDDLWTLLNEADFVVGQNSKRFDVKKIFARFVLNGMPKPSSFRQIDTLDIAKRLFGFTSNKLEYMTDKLCTVYKKKKHSQFPGHDLWAQCMKGNVEAWDEMQEYNEYDVLSLEELYDIISTWDNKLPNFDVYVDQVLDMSEWVEDGYHYSSLGKYKRYRNKVTGVERRSRMNELSKEKRQSLLSNIV